MGPAFIYAHLDSCHLPPLIDEGATIITDTIFINPLIGIYHLSKHVHVYTCIVHVHVYYISLSLNIIENEQ